MLLYWKSRQKRSFIDKCGNSFRVLTVPGNPGKSWNFILAFSRTGKSWKINAGPGKFWKSITLVIKFSFKKLLDCHFWLFFRKGLLLNYCAFGRSGKIYLSPREVLEKSWKIVSEKGYEPCSLLMIKTLPICTLHMYMPWKKFEMWFVFLSANKPLQTYWWKKRKVTLLVDFWLLQDNVHTSTL